MELVLLDDKNIADEHICCAISDKKCAQGYQKKKDWLQTQFADGYRFQKLDVRGKVFIEYGPIEKTWLPLDGKNFMVIGCFWVSGQFKGKGNGKRLLNQCFSDASQMDGVVAITGDKKRPFMSDPKFLKAQGFEIIDEAPPFFKLWARKTNPNAENPKFRDSARSGSCPNKTGITAYYSNACPYTEFYVGQALAKYAKTKGVSVEIHKLETRQQARQMPIPWIINSIFYNGELVTLEMKPDRHLDKLI